MWGTNPHVEEPTLMTKQEAFSSRVDLKDFFEASISALQHENRSLGMAKHPDQRHVALVQRAVSNDTLKNRAVADATRALAALWKIQTSKRTI
jgi:hypothetical protein